MLIALHAKKRSGKDTVGSFLTKHASKHIQTIAFADRLKAMSSAMFELPLDFFYDQALKEVYIPHLGMSPRDIMIKIERPMKDAFGEDIFVRAVRDKYHVADQQGVHTLVTDLRFPGPEEDFIRKNGGMVIHIIRNTGEQPLDHASERGLPIQEGDIVIHNDGTLEELEAKVASLVITYGL